MQIFVMMFMVIVLFFMVSNSSDSKGEPPDLYIYSRPNPDNCQQYYNRFNTLIDCGMEQRFDITTGTCKHYYFTDCGDRYNPPYPTSAELCANYFNNLTTQDFYPHRICQRYYQCLYNNRHILDLICYNNTLFDITTQTCLDSNYVDCGSRD
uniref:ADOR66 n=1 Tax=Adoxophyes orana granulovirus TaxID=170617 RepID=A0A0A7V0P8_GVAO|nr:ADOR66 [Adoxophyes orana granulovirus]